MSMWYISEFGNVTLNYNVSAEILMINDIVGHKPRLDKMTVTNSLLLILQQKTNWNIRGLFTRVFAIVYLLLRTRVVSCQLKRRNQYKTHRHLAWHVYCYF